MRHLTGEIVTETVTKEEHRPIGKSVISRNANLSDYDKALLYRALNTERNTIMDLRRRFPTQIDEWNKQLASVQGMLLHFDLEEESNQVT